MIKILRYGVTAIVALACASSASLAGPLLGPDLLAQAVFSATYITLGSDAAVFGNILAGAATTVGAGTVIGGNLTTGAAATIGASSTVSGDIGAVGAVTVGAGAIVGGSVAAVGAITIGAGSTVGSQQFLASSPLAAAAFTASVNAAAASTALAVVAEQTALTNMGAGQALAASMATDVTLVSGVYSAASLSTTAGITMYFDGQGLANQYWVLNITDFLATGASTIMKIINAGPNSAVIWNVGGYASLGAGSHVIGTILAKTYVTVGANTDIIGAGNTCGGLYSAGAYISMEATAVVGTANCTMISDSVNTDQQGLAPYTAGGSGATSIVAAVPEPASWALLITGLLAIYAVKSRWRRRTGKSAD